MIKIRRSTFETNSSSSHNFSYINHDKELEPWSFGQIKNITFGHYGWGYDILFTINEKLSYIVTGIASNYYNYNPLAIETLKKDTDYIRLQDIIKNYTGYEFELNSCDGKLSDTGSIDHQSIDEWKQIMKLSDSDLLKFIMDDESYIEISNDNGGW